MLPEKRKELIIWIASIVGVIIVIIIMYNFAKFMRGLGANNEEVIVYDDPYPNDYVYYGFAVDEDKNYQLMGLDSEFNENQLGLRTFYVMNDLYYYNEHLVLYTDAINQINYNATDKKFNFYEQNSFFSNTTDVIITPGYYVFISNDRLEFCESTECSEKTTISEKLINDTVFNSENQIFYQLSDGVYGYDLSNGEEKNIVTNARNTLEFLAVDEEYLIFTVGNNYWMYTIRSGIAENLNEYVDLDDNYKFICLQNDNLYFQMTNEEDDNVLVGISLTNREILNDSYDIGSEEIINVKPLGDTLIYAELFKDEDVRYVIMDLEERQVIKELENPYVVIRGIEE